MSTSNSEQIKTAPASQGPGKTFKVTSNRLELPRGSSLTVLPGPVKCGDLVLVKVGGIPTIARYFPNITGFDWLIQPGLLIPLVGETPVFVAGRAVPIELAPKTKHLKSPELKSATAR